MKMPDWLRRFAPLYAAAVVLLFWLLLHGAVRSAAIPSPYETVLNFIRIFPGKLSVHLLASFGRVSAAILLSLAIGGALGIWTGMSRAADLWISPVVYLLYPLPKIAFLPILMILFGLGNTPKILLILLIIVFQFLLAARDGVREIPRELTDSVRSLGLGRAAVLRHLILPACAPKLFTALRISVGVSISVLFFSENFATAHGIGYFIMSAWAMADYVEMFSGILALSLFGLLLFSLIDLLERRVCRWMHVRKSA